MEAEQHAAEQPTNHRRNKREIKTWIKMNENENTTTQNLWDTVKAVLRGRFIAIMLTSINKKKVKQIT